MFKYLCESLKEMVHSGPEWLYLLGCHLRVKPRYLIIYDTWNYLFVCKQIIKIKLNYHCKHKISPLHYKRVVFLINVLVISNPCEILFFKQLLE